MEWKPGSEAFYHALLCLVYHLKSLSMHLTSRPHRRKRTMFSRQSLHKSERKGRKMIKGPSGWRVRKIRFRYVKQREDEHGDKRALHWRVCSCREKSLCGYFFHCFDVLSKSAVPEADFERNDLPHLSGFVSITQDVGQNLWRVLLVEKSGCLAIFIPSFQDICTSETSKYVTLLRIWRSSVF